MKIDEVTFTIFDFETTGLYPYSGDKICEIGAVKGKFEDRKFRKFHSLIDPQRSISYGAFLVNGITREMTEGQPTIESALPDFMKFIDGTVLVAYNAGFDLGFLECALGENVDALGSYQVIDALKLARNVFPGIGRYNLGAVSQALGFSVEGEHRALADAIMTWKIFQRELSVLSKEKTVDLEDIVNITASRRKQSAAEGSDRIQLIEEALNSGRRLNIRYRSVWNNSVTERVITPKKINKGYDKSYLVAHCHLRNEERCFRLDCILQAKSL